MTCIMRYYVTPSVPLVLMTSRVDVILLVVGTLHMTSRFSLLVPYPTERLDVILHQNWTTKLTAQITKVTSSLPIPWKIIFLKNHIVAPLVYKFSALLETYISLPCSQKPIKSKSKWKLNFSTWRRVRCQKGESYTSVIVDSYKNIRWKVIRIFHHS
jgi:hypothetical protein